MGNHSIQLSCMDVYDAMYIHTYSNKIFITLGSKTKLIEKWLSLSTVIIKKSVGLALLKYELKLRQKN